MSFVCLILNWIIKKNNLRLVFNQSIYMQLRRLGLSYWIHIRNTAFILKDTHIFSLHSYTFCGYYYSQFYHFIKSTKFWHLNVYYVLNLFHLFAYIETIGHPADYDFSHISQIYFISLSLNCKVVTYYLHWWYLLPF